MLPVLYSFRRCPYAMRARLAIVATGSSVALREVTLRAKPAAMLDLSPKGTVPVLALPDGSVIDESLDIMRWAFACAGQTAWLDEDAAALVATNDGAFKHHLDRYKYADRYGIEPRPHRDAATDLHARLDERLTGRAHLGADATSPVDLAIMPFVRQFAQTDRNYFDRLPLPCLHAWLARHLASRLFERAMVRLAPWQPGDAPIAFPG